MIAPEWSRWMTRWYEHGDREAGGQIVTELGAAVRLPRSLADAIGVELATEVEHDALVRLLDRELRLLLGVAEPRAFAATVARNLARDALRRHRRRGDQRDDRVSTDDLQVAAPTDGDPAIRVDAIRALALLSDLTEDARLAVLLVHAPDKMSDGDWSALQARHPSAAPAQRPAGALDREAASRMLWPPDLPETQPSRRRRLERLRKVLERAYAQLAAALGAR
jgi:hypothetical protein